VYRHATAPIVHRWLGGLHTGFVIKGLYLQRAIGRYLAGGTKTVFDAGCGPLAQQAVLLARRYPAHRFSGCDLQLDRAAVATQARRLGLTNLGVVEGDLTQHEPVPRYDVIYTIDVLEHIEDVESVLDRLIASLRAGGALLIHVPSPAYAEHAHTEERDWSRFREHRGGDDHVHDGFEGKQIRTWLERRGLSVLTVRPTFGPAAASLAAAYRRGERRGFRGIGLLLLAPALAAVLWEWLVAPVRGEGLWVEAVKPSAAGAS
ncbi:MAG: class I SAM-dependent methyltransferase, partial [Candidatus Rokuibacteriota bacterium]